MINVRKRDGRLEPLDLKKFSAVTQWACEGIRGVSSSEVELRSKIQFWNGITTSEIQETLIKSAADLISEEAPNYEKVAGRLISYHLRKSVYGRYQPTRLFDHVGKVTNLGFYDPLLRKRYTEEEFDEVDSFVDHRRDEELTYVAMEQMRGKYLVRDRSTGQILETPQTAMALIAMTVFIDYPPETRMYWVRELYECLSTHIVSLPTPIMAGVRTSLRQYSSCVLIDCGDSLDSISATATAVLKYVAQRAGIGINVGRIRAIGSKVRNGDATSTGLIPYIKLFQAAIQSCSQGAVRKGSGTLHFPLWHYEVEDLIVLKNNKGTDDVRARHVDYSVQLNKVMYERLLKGGNVTLFSPNDVPGLYDAFFTDVDEFRRLYEQYEKDDTIRKKVVPAAELFGALMTERKETGRIYLMNVDHVNDHGSFDKTIAPIYSSNLCLSGDTMLVVMDHTGEIHDIRMDELGAFIHSGDTMVWSRNNHTGQMEFRKITEFKKVGPTARVMRVTDTITGRSITCTPEHRVYTRNRGYVMAKDLQEDDELQVD